MKLELYTLVFVKKSNQILLGLKTRGFGVGLWNGFGGKLEKGENLIDGAKRELREESDLDVENLTHLGVVTYQEENKLVRSIVHVFITYNVLGNFKPSEEMNPIRWYNFQGIPYHKMWPDARLWYPYMLEDQHFLAVIKYDSDKIKDTHVCACHPGDISDTLNWGC